MYIGEKRNGETIWEGSWINLRLWDWISNELSVTELDLIILGESSIHTQVGNLISVTPSVKSIVIEGPTG